MGLHNAQWNVLYHFAKWKPMIRSGTVFPIAVNIPRLATNVGPLQHGCPKVVLLTEIGDSWIQDITVLRNLL